MPQIPQMLTFVSTKSQSSDMGIMTWSKRCVYVWTQCDRQCDVFRCLPFLPVLCDWWKMGQGPLPAHLLDLHLTEAQVSVRALLCMFKLNMDVLIITLQGCEWQMFQYALRNHVLPHSSVKLYSTHALFHCPSSKQTAPRTWMLTSTGIHWECVQKSLLLFLISSCSAGRYTGSYRIPVFIFLMIWILLIPQYRCMSFKQRSERDTVWEWPLFTVALWWGNSCMCY